MKKTKPIHPFFSFGLVFLQFGLIAALLLTSSISLHLFSIALQLLAIFIGLWAVQTMHLGHFNIIPDPMPDIKLVTRGPYQYIRHPMYLSIMLFFLPMVITNFNLLNVGLYFNLFIILFIKLHYEEYLLQQTLPDYPKYQSKTKKLIPFIL